MWACAHAPISRCISGWRDMCFRVLAAFNSFIFFFIIIFLAQLMLPSLLSSYSCTPITLYTTNPPTHTHTNGIVRPHCTGSNKSYQLGRHFRVKRILTDASCWRRETFPAQFVKACAVNADGYEEDISCYCSFFHSWLAVARSTCQL